MIGYFLKRIGLTEAAEKVYKEIDSKVDQKIDDLNTKLDNKIDELKNTVKAGALCCAAGYLLTQSSVQLYHSSSNLLYKLYLRFKKNRKTETQALEIEPLNTWDFINPTFNAACCIGCVATIAYSNNIIDYFTSQPAA